VRRDSWSTKKRSKLANKIVDEMAEKGKIRELYGNFKREVEQARDEKPGFRNRAFA
jgi:hypothetical protein